MSNSGQGPQPIWLNAQCPREGRYVIGPLLGRGGMGDVHEAWDVVLCRTVELKVLKAIEPAALIRFMHEAQIHARVVHPNICRIYDVDNYEGSLRVAMQLVLGPNLEQARQDLSLKDVVTIVALVAQAVHVVHRLNLVHRDLKPSNILLERSAEGQWVPFVCDFGLAMAMDEPALTYTHGVIGTPAYMAPEQMHGDRNRISPATDVFALGGTLCFALTGAPPGIKGAKAAAGDPAIPRDLRVIIGKCLEEDPGLRYPTAAALAEDLWRFLEGEPIQATNPHPLFRMGRKALRSARSYLLVLAAAVLTAAVLLALHAHSVYSDRRQMFIASRMALEAENMAKDLRLEMMLPIHDLRPSYARIRTQAEQYRAQLPGLAPRWQSEVLFALGIANGLLHAYPAAKIDLERSWATGLHEPEVANLLAWDNFRTALAGEDASLFASGQPAPAPGSPEGAQESLQPVDQARDTSPTAAAMAAYLARDYPQAAAASHAVFLAAPWRWEAAALEVDSLRAMGKQQLNAGELARAIASYQAALTAAKGALAIGQSDPALYHSCFMAARALGALLTERGGLSAPFMEANQAASDRALRLDPDDPDLQDDWAMFRWQDAMRLLQLGKDPEHQLEAARTFLETRTREPLTVRLRATRMLVYWQLAEREFSRGLDPGPDLTEALRTAGHTPFLLRDYLWEVMNFKARVDAARGIDPRPALAEALDHFQPLEQSASWSQKESFARTWLIRAEWEAGHGLDPGASLRHARTLTAGARNSNPDSARAYALEGLSRVLEIKAFPGERERLLPLAWEALRLAQARNPLNLDQARLKRQMEVLDK